MVRKYYISSEPRKQLKENMPESISAATIHTALPNEHNLITLKLEGSK